jgi:23S rRNA (cytidine1920-2'-O)/16S rRNA (cytidine1409-2'-O)-methyltransferase
VKRRLDQALVAAGLAASRARAQALIAAGVVRVDGHTAGKPSEKVADTASLALDGDPLPWVSRAALKLEHALQVFAIDASGLIALDLGASTGGFSQVLLASGAAEVWAVEVGRGQLHPQLRAHPRLHLLERKNVRDLAPDEVPPPDLIVADLSFIPLATALPVPLALARPGARLVALIKPQFEAGPADVGKGGIVRDPAVHQRVRESVRRFLEASGWQLLGEAESPIAGGDGNAEFLVAARKPG